MEYKLPIETGSDWSFIAFGKRKMEPSGKKGMETLEQSISSAFSQENTQHSRRKEEAASYDNYLRCLPEVAKVASKGRHRFGSLSHNSFFSRHNPHPNRVTHIQGLNGNPVCMVNDDCYVATPLSPHPFIKSQIPWTTFGSPAIQIPFSNLSGNNAAIHNAALLSETWREELKDLAAKVSMSASGKKDKRPQQAVDEPARRKTQYSAQTGRIIPPSSQASGRRPPRAHFRSPRPQGPTFPPALHDQELMVLELLCQILQTDSLSCVQQWLMLAGQREKEMVMDLIQKAVDSSVLNYRDTSLDQEPHSSLPLPSRASSTGQQSMKYSFSSSHKVREVIAEEDKPERIGTAEVLLVHSGEAPHLGESDIATGINENNQLQSDSL
ncbi:hypothetical protein AGOR_G00199990 [Albula goreensis]|uniref:Protein TBATA n=1 Tax=Albula goreensis TaxID=1534307 RepID=A0A8T3CW51_9TELE|nr:hypothetical protein AGOR_G00199990 [Albula goreensis]